MLEKIVCSDYKACGGCTHQDIPYEEELAMKLSAVQTLLQPLAVDVCEGIKPAPCETAYRNKMEFAFGDESKDGLLALGIRKRRNFYEVVTPRQCNIIPEDFRSILLTVLEYFRGTNETFYHRKRHMGSLRHLILRRGEFTGELLVNLSTTSQMSVPLSPLVEKIRHTPLAGRVVGILHTVNDGVADTVKNEQVQTLWGRDYFFEKIGSLTFKVSAFSFFQTNSAGAALLYNTVSEYAGHGGLIYDLYCGTGTIAQVIASNASKVVGVEIVEEAVKAAVDNAALNGINNVQFIAGDVMVVAASLTDAYGQPDTVIVDPPRDGLHPKALSHLITINAPKIVYVSCKPSSLARDAALFIQQGYHMERMVCVDMFPRTAHVECVVLMSRKDD